MATYMELFGLQGDSDLQDKVSVAIIVAAETIRTEDGGTANHANRLIWAKEAFSNPGGTTQKMLWAILAQNKAATVVQITGATDAAIQANVDSAVDVFATGV